MDPMSNVRRHTSIGVRQQPSPRVRTARPARRTRSAWWPFYHRGWGGWLIHPALSGAFVGLAVGAHSLQADALDVHITREVQRWTSLDGVLTGVSWLGYSPQDVVIALAILATLAAVGFRIAALWLAVSVTGAGILDWAIKLAVGRQRPPASLVHVARHNADYSFPSGHVLSYVALYGFLLAFAWLRVKQPVVRLLIAAPCAALVLLIGPSRVYLGAHWASDVLGAYLLGAVWLSVIVQLYAGRIQLPSS
jgi:membrane-associated phospholipid phosphatase